MEHTFLLAVPRLHAELSPLPSGCRTLWPGLPRRPEHGWEPAFSLPAPLAAACLADFERASRDGATGSPVLTMGAEHAPADLSDAERRALREMAGQPAEEPEQPLRQQAQQVLLLVWLQEKQALDMAELEQKIRDSRRELASLISGRTRIGEEAPMPAENDLPDWRRALAAELAFLPDMPAPLAFYVTSPAMAAAVLEAEAAPAELPAEALPEGCRAVTLPAGGLAALCGRSAADRLRRELGEAWARPVTLCLPSRHS